MKLFTKIMFAVLLLAGFNARAEEQDRHLSGFHAVNVQGSFDVYITQGGNESVKVEAPSDVVDRIITEVKGDVLIVRNKQGFNWDGIWNGHKKTVVYVSLKSVYAVKLSGSGDVRFTDGLNAPKFELGISGSGDVTGKLETQNLDCHVSGSGDIKLNGRADNANISISGSGDFSGSQLVTGTTAIRLSGSGDASINVSQKLDVRISGSGDVRYTGGVRNVSSSTSGSGDVRRF